MVEYHAWATVLPEGDSLRISQSLLEELRRRVEEISLGSGFGQIRASNGDQHLFLTGQPKHRSAEIEDLFELWQFLAREAPDSHGLLYLWDDEDPEHDNEFRVWVLQRGKITERTDPFLSPVDLTMVGGSDGE